ITIFTGQIGNVQFFPRGDFFDDRTRNACVPARLRKVVFRRWLAAHYQRSRQKASFPSGYTQTIAPQTAWYICLSHRHKRPCWEMFPPLFALVRIDRTAAKRESEKSFRTRLSFHQ